MWIQTASGRRFDLIVPTPSMIDVSDIATALSNICRFTGHVREFYSVAQHSVAVSYLVPETLALPALLHDAAEAYVGDVSRPLKQLLPDYRQVEARVWAAVAMAFDIDRELDPAIKRADTIALLTERRDLLQHLKESATWDAEIEALLPFVPQHRIVPLAPIDARDQFLARYFELTAPSGQLFATERD